MTTYPGGRASISIIEPTGIPPPFGFPSLTFSKADVWRHHDHAYKSGTHIKGHRTRLLFDLLDLDHVAGKKILDVGCGNGQFAVFFAMYGAEVWGIDISEVGIDVANRTAQANNVADAMSFHGWRRDQNVV